MLSTASSSSTLLSALQAIAGGKKSGLTQGVSEDGPSFGDLLSTLSGLAISGDKAADPAATEEQALALPVAGPAIAGGKFLPGMLPTLPEGEAEGDLAAADTDAKDAPIALTPEMMQLLLAGLPVPALPAAAEAGEASAAPAKSASPASPPMPVPAGTDALAALQQPATKQDRRAAPAEISITVRADSQATAEAPVAETAEPVATAPTKSATAALTGRAEAPVVQQLAPQFSTASPDAPSTSTHHAAGHVTSLHNANAVDIGATLDRLVAAREALMPAQATLDIDHADFGEVSIRIEQTVHGHLSVELAGSDPDLKRAVAAAVQADSATAGNQDNAASRSGTQHRDNPMDRGANAGSGSEARSQSERNTQGRREGTRQRDDHAQSESRSGTFA
ncbi:hypothetical protein [Altererythrobacter sp. Root672]|uniref:hypothetical protein n=1 Tax=Altererythrobacter sp. Root672 TaxID=1736584 RepID=UPI0006F247A2|nr:hypothetical protein [Altererythrobacter sp. Root672]KRA82847.1 hypothetical protein ASD76_01775 [Altererythrobacter sp. Root672]